MLAAFIIVHMKPQIRGIIAPVAMHAVHKSWPISRLKEIFGAPTSGCRNSTLVVRHSREDREAWVEVFAEVHDRGDIPAAVAVIGRAPNGDDGFVLEMPLNRYISREWKAAPQITNLTL